MALATLAAFCEPRDFVKISLTPADQLPDLGMVMMENVQDTIVLKNGEIQILLVLMVIQQFLVLKIKLCYAMPKFC